MTNYEKIKTMSVDELAELLRDFRCCVELDWCKDIERCRSCKYHSGYEMERPDEFGISYVCRRAILTNATICSTTLWNRIDVGWIAKTES